MTTRVLLLGLLTMAFLNNGEAKKKPLNGIVDRKPVAVPGTALPIKIDGVFEEEAWKAACRLELNYEVQPGENTAPPVKTELFITYDHKNVYFAFKAYDPEPRRIKAHLSDRDRLNQDDWVGVVLDTFNDERRSFDLLVNPLGVQSDFIEMRDVGEGEWDAIWESAGKIHDWGYCVEIRCPFSSLRFQRAAGPQVWGIDAVRSYPRDKGYYLGLFPRDRNNNCYLCQTVKIQGFEGVSPGKNLEIVPTLTGVRTDTRPDFPDGPMVNQDKSLEAGVTARWGFTPNLTLSATINPDFSQVEADAQQLSINEPFAIYYPEKRPFFMEGADFFSTTLNAVYTRMMQEPAWGVKVTGKEQGNTLAGYVVRDDITNILFPGNQGSSSATLEANNLSTVLRYKRDFGRNYTLGALFTGRQGDDYRNVLGGFDGNFRFTDKDSLSFQVLHSSSRYPDEVAEDYAQPFGNFGDWAMDVTYSHDARNLSWWGEFRSVGNGFRADLGFIPRVGYRGYAGGGGYNWYPAGKSWFYRFNLQGQYVLHQDMDGNLLDRSATAVFSYEGNPRRTHATFQYTRKREQYNNLYFDQNSFYTHYCGKPFGDSHFYLNLTVGDRIDYDNTRPGKRVRVAGGLTCGLTRHLRAEISHTFERMKVNVGHLYTANLAQLSLSYQFNTRTLVRAILQYTDYRYSPENYTFPIDSKYQQLFTQLLFSYKINPHTVLFLGYSDNGYGSQEYTLRRYDRTFFMKLGYAWTL